MKSKYHGGDEPFEQFNRLSPERITDQQDDEDVTGGDQNTCPQREFREQHNETHGGAEEFRKIGAYNGDLCENIERVEDEPAVE